MAKEFEYVEKNISKNKDVNPGTNKWWKIEGDDVARSVFALVAQISNTQFRFWRANFIFAQLYENIDSLITSTSSPLFTQYFDISPTNQIFNSKLTYNVVKSCVDAVTAKIAKNKPRVKFVTSGGDHKLQKRAKDLTKYVDGIFYETDIYTHAASIFRDACVFGTGCLKIYTEPFTNKVKIDRVIVPVEIIVDMTDARYGQPKQIHQRKVYPRDVLLNNYPDKADGIKSASSLPNPMGISDDQVVVIESWHLPSVPGAKDGRHVICVDNTPLIDEVYEKDYFPFVFYKYSNRMQGFFGYGLTEELSFIQLAINKTHKMIQAAQEINSVPRWFVEAGSLQQKHGFYSGGLMEYKPGSSPPIPNTSPAMTADIYNYLETLFQKAYQVSGISQLSAAGQKPAGLDSGVALREYQDINAERFAIQGDRYEQLFLNAAEIIIDLSRDLFKDGINNRVKAKSVNGKFIESIDWKDCDLDNQDFSMECFPVSKLPNTPEGRLAFITELTQAGVIQRNQMLELMEMPDIENFYSLSNASMEKTLIDLDKIVENDEMQTPDPHMDLTTAKAVAQAYYLHSCNTNVEEERLDKLREYINQIDLLLTPPAPPGLPGMPLGPIPGGPVPPPIGPQAVPEPRPVSAMLPNIPQ